MGYSRSFSANYFCRICKIHKEKINEQYVENKLLLRNEDNYWQDVNQNNASLTDVREACIMYTLPSFRISNNISVDVMHDLFEGICHVEMCYILNNLILKRSYLTLDMLNYVKQNTMIQILQINQLIFL